MVILSIPSAPIRTIGMCKFEPGTHYERIVAINSENVLQLQESAMLQNGGRAGLLPTHGQEVYVFRMAYL